MAQYLWDPGAWYKTAAGVLNGIVRSSRFRTPGPVAPAVQPRPPQNAEVEKLKQEGEKLAQTIADIPDLAKFKDQIQITMAPDGLRIELIEQAEGCSTSAAPA